MEIDMRFSWGGVRRLFFWLVGFELVLLLAYLSESAVGSGVWTVERLLDLDGEQSVAAWFSVVQLAAIGVLFLIKALTARPEDGVPRWFLVLGCGGFFFLSMDEHLELHETITKIMIQFDWMPRFSGDHGVWVFFYLGAGLLLLLVSIRPVKTLWCQYNYSFLLMAAGAGVFLLGAVVLEILAYEFLADEPLFYYVLEVAAEEFMEMLGATSILCGAAFYVLEAEARPITANDVDTVPGLLLETA
ncbi:MAG TPA: hypothetical protein VFY81_13855 [Gammaproteobacteria bacterium]|nr:hypothetical protein [Gammaproteobacteria bacterium]